MNESVVEGRLASLEETFRRTLRKREEQLRQSQIKGHQDRIIRMREGGIRNLKADYERKKLDVEAGRRLSRSYQLKRWPQLFGEQVPFLQWRLAVG